MKKILWILLCATVTLAEAASVESCDAARKKISEAEQLGNKDKKFSILQQAVKECPAADTLMALASSYINEQMPDEAILVLSKAESHVSSKNTILFGFLNALKSEAYIQEKRLCKAHRSLIHAKNALGMDHALIKEVDLAFEFERSRQLLDEKTLGCMLSATRSASERGVGIRPSINISIPFATASELPTEVGSKQVIMLANILSNNEYKNYKFVLIGHADTRGDAEYNMNLSVKRANQILKEVTERIPSLKERVLSKGKGENSPKSQGNDAKSHAINRRVEVVLKRL